jgi:peroxiredoxin
MKYLPEPGCRAGDWRRVTMLSGLLATLLLIPAAGAGDAEYTGKFAPQLAANRENLDQVIFRPVRDLAKLKLAQPLDREAQVTAARLYHAPTDKAAILALLVEPEGELPYLYADVDLNNVLDETERVQLTRSEEDNPYLWEATVNQPLKEGPFASFPVLLQYFKGVEWEEMKAGERMVLQSTEVFARGFVEIQGKQTLVQYGYNPRSRKINPTSGQLGIDGDDDGEIDIDRFSPEAAEAQEEVVVFRVGQHYVSTKRADVDKNLIVLKAHPASDYKRIELRLGGEMPDFGFTDFNGKKRRLAEFRGQYLLLDFWGTWCGPCRREMPYLRAAHKRFQARGFEILGLNTDDPQIISQVKTWLERNELTWPQATRESIRDLIRSLRIHAYPTTLLLDPDGKVISLNQTRRGQPSLRGEELLKSLDQLLPP